MQQPSDLISNTSQGYKISMTFGLVTQDELLDILELPKGASVPASVIKSEQVTLENHVGQPTKQYLISNRGLPCDIIHSIRQVEFYFTAFLSQDEYLLRAARQLEDDQATHKYDFHCKQQLNCNPKPFKNSAGHSAILDAEGMKGKIVKEAAKRGEDLSTPGGKDEDASDAEGSKKVRGGPSRYADPPSKKNPKAKSSKKALASGREEEIEEAVFDDAGAGMFAGDLRLVLDELKSTPKCFNNLSVERIFKGERLMRSTEAVVAPVV